MANFWLTKKMVLEALRMTEGQPQNTTILFKGDSESVNGKIYTIVEIMACGKKKTIREEFKGETL